MRSYIPSYELATLPSLAATLERMAREPGAWKPFAGGTDLMVLLEAGKLPHLKFLNIAHLNELRGIEITAAHVCVGSLTTYSEIRRQEILEREFPLLCRAAEQTGSIATQNRGTLGGNIANASPAADSSPALLVYDAELEMVSSAGARWTPYSRFHSGYKQMDLQPQELIRRIRLPRPKQPRKQSYRKVGTRRAQAISKICFAGVARMEGGRIGEIRLAFGSVAYAAVRVPEAENILRGQKPSLEIALEAQAALLLDIAPIADMRSTAEYRLRVAQNLLGEFIQSLAE
ncbi:MAG: FAD binding domain-containing protein [Candidatus Binataceae bacterium]